jgi:hypothetical protein
VGDSGLGTSVQYAGVVTEEGTRLDVASLSFSIDAGDVGILQPSFLVLDSNRASMSDGIDFSWRGWSAEVQWSRKIADDLAVGANLSYMASTTDFRMGSIRLTEARSATWQLRLGLLHEVSDRFYFGVDLEGSAAPSRARNFDFLGTGAGTDHDRDTTVGAAIRPGIYAFLTDDLTIYADYQFAAFRNDSGHLMVHRLYVGFDQTIVDGLYLRGGGVVDHEGNVSLAVGVGIAPSDSVYVDVAYEHDMFPELEPEFGRADLFGIGLTVLF